MKSRLNELSNYYSEAIKNPFTEYSHENYKTCKYTTLYSAKTGVWQLPHADFAPTKSKYSHKINTIVLTK